MDRRPLRAGSTFQGRAQLLRQAAHASRRHPHELREAARKGPEALIADLEADLTRGEIRGQEQLLCPLQAQGAEKLPRRDAGYPPERAGEVIRAEVSDLGHRSQGKRFVYPLPHLRDHPLYGRAVRRVDAGRKVGLEPYRSFHGRILREQIRFPSPRFRLRPCSLASLAGRGAFERFMIPNRSHGERKEVWVLASLEQIPASGSASS